MDLAQNLHAYLAPLAPLAGVSIGDADDKSTWRLDFAEDASPAQRQAAETALSQYDPAELLLAPLRAERDRRLNETDWVVVRSLETGEPVPPEWTAYRQALRDLPGTIVNPAQVVWPQPPA